MNHPTPESVEEKSGQHVPASTLWFATLLVIALGLLDVCFYVLYGNERTLWTIEPSIHLYQKMNVRSLGNIIRGAVVGQVALVCFAVVWTRINAVLLLLFAGVCLLGLAKLGATTESAPTMAWFGGLITYGLMMLLPLQLAKTLGLSLSHYRPGSRTILLQQKSRWNWQFTLWSLLSITTAVAIAITASKFAEFPIGTMLQKWPAFVFLATTALATLATILYRWRTVYFAIAALGSLVLVVAALLFLLPGLFLTTGFRVPDFLANWFVVAAAAIVLRIAGLRLGWQT